MESFFKVTYRYWTMNGTSSSRTMEVHLPTPGTPAAAMPPWEFVTAMIPVIETADHCEERKVTHIEIVMR